MTGRKSQYGEPVINSNCHTFPKSIIDALDRVAHKELRNRSNMMVVILKEWLTENGYLTPENEKNA